MILYSRKKEKGFRRKSNIKRKSKSYLWPDERVKRYAKPWGIPNVALGYRKDTQIR
jgi:hypothetical protein